MGYAIKLFSFLFFCFVFLPKAALRRWFVARFGAFFSRYGNLIAVIFIPMKLWMHAPQEYPSWSVPLLWRWAEARPMMFDPRHPQGPRAKQNFTQFYPHVSEISDWVFYASAKDSVWFLSWWPKLLMDTTILGHVVTSTLWERGAVVLWELSPDKTFEGVFGQYAGNHPKLVQFLKTHPHKGLSSMDVRESHAWSPEMLMWVLEGHTSRVQGWLSQHAQSPRPAWEYLSDLTQDAMGRNYVRLWSGVYHFELELWEAQRFDALFPLEGGWSWAKVFALYGVDSMGLAASVSDWAQEEAATIEAGHICYHDGHRVTPEVLGQAIGWELSLLLGHPEWKAWTGPQRIAAILGPREAQASLPIEGLV